jgi:hypothetical protein
VSNNLRTDVEFPVGYQSSVAETELKFPEWGIDDVFSCKDRIRSKEQCKFTWAKIRENNTGFTPDLQ